MSTQSIAVIPTPEPPALQRNQALSVFSGGESFIAAQRMGKALCSSSLVPEQYRGDQNLGNCLIALEISGRIGASVLAVMQSLDIIHGRPSWRATFLIATVNTCGRFTPLRFRFQGKEGSDDWGCRAVATDKATGEELIGSLITVALAKSEGWAGKTGSKWKTMPEQMLTYRAASFWTRAYAPELSLGMRTQDEVLDSVEEVRETPARPVFGRVVTEAIAAPAADRLTPLREWMAAESITEAALLPCLNAALLEEGSKVERLEALTDEELADVMKNRVPIVKALKGGSNA